MTDSPFLARLVDERKKENERETGSKQQKIAIMEVNYEGVIAEGKTGRSKESIGDSPPFFFLPSLLLSLSPSCLVPSFFILLVFLGCQATVTPREIEASSNYKNSVDSCPLMP